MSVVQACAETEAAIQRARALFASEPEPAAGAANAAGAVQNAAQSTTAAGQTTTDMSGGFIDAHKMFVDESAPKLSAAAQTDTALQAHTATAATLTQAGARRLDAIAAETRATSQAAATVRTPAGERAILVALRSQLARANDVVTTTKQQAAGLAGQVRALKYPPASTGHGDTQALGFGPGGAPAGPAARRPPARQRSPLLDRRQQDPVHTRRAACPIRIHADWTRPLVSRSASGLRLHPAAQSGQTPARYPRRQARPTRPAAAERLYANRPRHRGT